ncbi:MAG: alpha/beta-hydrolase family protein [Actinobacteria bacterium]|nr:alpha/beta-hydrolase family protein [Actinomycetota bacterium]
MGDSAIVTMQYSFPLTDVVDPHRTRKVEPDSRPHAARSPGTWVGDGPRARPKFVLFGESLGALHHAGHLAAPHGRGHRPRLRALVDLPRHPVGHGVRQGVRLNPAKVDPHGQVIEVDNFSQCLDLPDEHKGRVRHVLPSL